jgi:hypothetical protein
MASLVKTSSIPSIKHREDSSSIIHFLSSSNNSSCNKMVKRDRVKSHNDVKDGDNSVHSLNRKWILWSHLPQNPDWTLKSYNQICTLNTLEDVIAVLNIIPDSLLTSCMLFIMREGITPMWEDVKNKDGGCFKYRIINKHVPQTLKHMVYTLVGETLSSNKLFLQNVTGITISPKKKFCILKVWTSNCDFQNSDVINIDNIILNTNKAIFEIHDVSLNKELNINKDLL